MQYSQKPNSTVEVGFCTSAQDYLLYLHGLPSAHLNDIIVTARGSKALVVALEREKVEALMLDPERPKPGDIFTLIEGGLQFPLSENLLGRTINPLGAAKDGQPEVQGDKKPLELDIIASGIGTRARINKQLKTGLTLVDTLLPIGQGQRELIYGEPRSGQQQFLLDCIVNQKDSNVVCLYAALGKSDIDTKRFVTNLSEAGALPYTIILSATSSEATPVISIAPAVAFFIADYFRAQGKDVLVILDDLGTQAKYLREIALKSARVPGRESYPADIFYQHAHLMERAGNYNKENGGGSITLLPVIESSIENFSNLIPTNLMSSTDGHLLFSASLRSEGQYPAIDTAKSVTRVGHQTQALLHKVLSDRIRSLLADFDTLKRYGQFGAELTSQTQQTIKRGMIAGELLRQEPLATLTIDVQIALLSLLFTPFFDDRDIEFIRTKKPIMVKTLTDGDQFKALYAKKIADLDSFIIELDALVPMLEAACQ